MLMLIVIHYDHELPTNCHYDSVLFALSAFCEPGHTEHNHPYVEADGQLDTPLNNTVKSYIYYILIMSLVPSPVDNHNKGPSLG